MADINNSQSDVQSDWLSFYRNTLMEIRKRPAPDKLSTAVITDASGTVTAVTGVAGKKIVIWGIILTAPAAHTLTFKDGSIALTGAMATQATALILPPQITERECYALFETTAGSAFVIAADTTIQVSGIVYYTLE